MRPVKDPNSERMVVNAEFNKKQLNLRVQSLEGVNWKTISNVDGNSPTMTVAISAHHGVPR